MTGPLTRAMVIGPSAAKLKATSRMMVTKAPTSRSDADDDGDACCQTLSTCTTGFVRSRSGEEWGSSDSSVRKTSFTCISLKFLIPLTTSCGHSQLVSTVQEYSHAPSLLAFHTAADPLFKYVFLSLPLVCLHCCDMHPCTSLSSLIHYPPIAFWQTEPSAPTITISVCGPWEDSSRCYCCTLQSQHLSLKSKCYRCLIGECNKHDCPTEMFRYCILCNVTFWTDALLCVIIMQFWSSWDMCHNARLSSLTCISMDGVRINTSIHTHLYRPYFSTVRALELLQFACDK